MFSSAAASLWSCVCVPRKRMANRSFSENDSSGVSIVRPLRVNLMPCSSNLSRGRAGTPSSKKTALIQHCLRPNCTIRTPAPSACKAATDATVSAFPPIPLVVVRSSRGPAFKLQNDAWLTGRAPRKGRLSVRFRPDGFPHCPPGNRRPSPPRRSSGVFEPGCEPGFFIWNTSGIGGEPNESGLLGALPGRPLPTWGIGVALARYGFLT